MAAPERPGMLRKALTWATTPSENTKFLGEQRKAIVDRYAATHGPAPLGLTKDSGDLGAGLHALVSGAVPGSGDVPMGAEAEARTQQFRQEHPALSILLPMAGGLGRPGMLPTQRVPKVVDPVLEQIRRVGGAAPAAADRLPALPKALDFLIPSKAKLAYKLLRAVAGKSEGVAASNPYPAEAGAAQAMSSMGPVPPPAAAARELNPALQAAQAESRARVLSRIQPTAVEAPPVGPVAPPSQPAAPVQSQQALPAATNIYEQAGRANKVQELVKAIDANAGAHLGIDPRDPRFAEALADLPTEWWEGMGRVAKVNKPSPQTVSDTMAFFRDRAAQAVPRAAAK